MRSSGAPGSAGQLLLPLAVMAAALLAGLATTVLAGALGLRAVYFVAIAGALAGGIGIALLRTEPLRFIYLSMLAILPLLHVPLPPGRFGYTLFDAGVLVLTLGLLLSKTFRAVSVPGRPLPGDAPLFPTRTFAFIWVLLLPSALLAFHPLHAWETLGEVFCAYVFFWYSLQELRRPGGFERLVSLLCVAAIIVAVGLFVDRFLHISLSMRGRNLNELTLSSADVQISRVGGFFQDPQKAGDFLAALMVFMMVLLARRGFTATRMRLLLWSAMLLGLPALLLTVSRAAILSSAAVGVVMLVAASRWPLVIRLGFGVALLLLGTSLALQPEAWSKLLPAQLSQRLADSQGEMQNREAVWMDTWDMFTSRPVTGIGFGGFRQYLLDTRPSQTNYYGIGADTDSGYVPDQPESGYLKIFYETGILGSVATLLLVIATARRAMVRLRRTAPDSAERTRLIAALAGMASFALTFITLFTTNDSRMLALFILLLAMIWGDAAPAPDVPVRSA